MIVVCILAYIQFLHHSPHCLSKKIKRTVSRWCICIYMMFDEWKQQNWMGQGPKREKKKRKDRKNVGECFWIVRHCTAWKRNINQTIKSKWANGLSPPNWNIDEFIFFMIKTIATRVHLCCVRILMIFNSFYFAVRGISIKNATHAKSIEHIYASSSTLSSFSLGSIHFRAPLKQRTINVLFTLCFISLLLFVRRRKKISTPPTSQLISCLNLEWAKLIFSRYCWLWNSNTSSASIQC